MYDRFFKITRENGSFKESSPFLLHKALQSTFGTLKDTRKMADGSLLIEVANERQSDLASNLSKLHDFVVSSTAHKTLNVIKGVITCRDLQYCSDQEILENLKDQGVVEIYRIPQKRGIDSPSSNFILTFKLHQLPPRIFVGWYSIRVRPYFSPPMRCFACQRFGHTSAKCSFEPICPSCGHHPHPDEQCSLPAKCINCDDPHSPRYKGCSRYKIEFEISKIKTIEKINYFEAKRKYSLQHPPQSTLFSTITKGLRTKMVSVSTQCDFVSNVSPSPSIPPAPSKSSSFSTTPITRPTPPSSSPSPKKHANLHPQSFSSQSPSPTSHLPPPSTNRIPSKLHPISPSDPPPSSSHPKPLTSPTKSSSKTSHHPKDEPYKSNKPDHKPPPPKSSSSKNTLSRSTSITSDKPKRKPSRSAKSSSASSSESILELSSSESMLIDPPIP